MTTPRWFKNTDVPNVKYYSLISRTLGPLLNGWICLHGVRD